MVKVFDWKEEYSVGVREIDAQHQELVAILNELNGALLKAKGAEISGPIIARLAEYAARHFADEERLLKKYAYPEERQHKAEHDSFLARLGKFRKEYERGNKLVAVDLMQFVKQWFVDHLQTTDYRYASFLKEQRLEGQRK